MPRRNEFENEKHSVTADGFDPSAFGSASAAKLLDDFVASMVNGLSFAKEQSPADGPAPPDSSDTGTAE